MSAWQFENPLALWSIALIVPTIALALWLVPGQDRFRRLVFIFARCALLVLLGLILAAPQRITEHDRLTVVALADVSGSVRFLGNLPPAPVTGHDDNLAYLRSWLRSAANGPERDVDDRFGIVAFDGRARAVTIPTIDRAYQDLTFDRSWEEGTNIADAIQFSQALLGSDSAARIVLLSDGVQTDGQVLDAIASMQMSGDASGLGRVPIDVVPIPYRITSEVQMVRVEVPTLARPGQRITVRLVLESTAAVRGTVDLLLEGAPVDLNGAAPGLSRAVQLEAGTNIVLAETTLREASINRFEAIFTPDDESFDTLRANNSAQAFTATPGRGSILVLDGVYEGRGTVLPGVFAEAGFAVDVRNPEEFPSNPIELQAFDLIVLQNVPAEDLSAARQEALVRYVEEFGGGLIMTGGYDAYGAGGWVDTPVAKILPIDVEVPDELHVPTAAIAIVLDRSGSMRESGGPGRSKQEVANEGAAIAIGTLDPSDWISVIAFDESPEVIVPVQRVDDAQWVQQRVRSISPLGGTNLGPALRRAVEQLETVEADVKHVLCLSDGRSEPDDFDGIVQDMRTKGITLSAIAVGDASSGMMHSDEALLRQMAEEGGGEFYIVWNPEILPRIFVKDIRVIRRPMIRESDFTPTVRSSASPIAGAIAQPIPPLHGFVLTQERVESPDASVLLTTPDGFPLLATWQAGLGRVTTFMSDAHDQWASSWIDWPGFAALWTAIARTTARPAGSTNYELNMVIEEGFVEITLFDADHDVNAEDGPPMPLPSVSGVVFGPSGERTPVRLRPISPGVYQTRIRGAESGHYVAALTPRREDRAPEIVIGGVSQQQGIEYRHLSSNTGLLETLAERTGGRVLDPLAPQSASLFDRSDLASVRSFTPVWRPLTLAAVILLLIDVALRRIAWSTHSLLARLHLVARRTEGCEAQRAMAGAMSSLRQTVRSTGERGGGGGATIDPYAPTMSEDSATDARAESASGSDAAERERAEAERAEREAQAQLEAAKRRQRALDLLSGQGRSSVKKASSDEPTGGAEKRSSAASLSSQLLKRRRGPAESGDDGSKE